MEGQETKRFVRDGKSARLLVGWEDNFVPLWESGERRFWRHRPSTCWTTLIFIKLNQGGDIFLSILLCLCLNV
jgi:hypothetical protein